MSHNSLTGFDRPLRVELRTCRIQFAIPAALYGLAALAASRVPLAGTIYLPLLVMLFTHAVYLYRMHISLSASGAVRAISWNPLQGWSIRCGDGWETAQLCLPVFVTYRLVALRFRTGRLHKRRVIITAGRLDEGDFRRLRVRLLQSAHGRGDRKKIPGA